MGDVPERVDNVPEHRVVPIFIYNYNYSETSGAFFRRYFFFYRFLNKLSNYLDQFGIYLLFHSQTGEIPERVKM